MKYKKPLTNPAIYIIYAIFIVGMCLYFIQGFKNIAYPVPFGIIMVVLFLLISRYALRPLYPLELDTEKLIIKYIFFFKHEIKITDIVNIEKMNRYDKLEIKTYTKTYNLSFVLRTDEFVKDINKSIKKSKNSK